MTTITTGNLQLLPLGTPSNLAAGTYTTPKFDVRHFEEILFGLQVPTLTGGGTLNVFIDVSTDGGTAWHQLGLLGPANIATPPATNPYPSTYILTTAVHQNTAFGEYVRVRYVLAGTITTLSLGIYAIAKGS